ncbi:MAG: hypothetical protein V2I43_29000 [Parvularcula sp.]|jgi:hypothetical protein|nr:hypothetical protein [Parvularcula sp.]
MIPFRSLRRLTNPDEPLSPYILNAWAVATIPAIVISMVVGLFASPEAITAQEQAVVPPEIPFAVTAVSVIVFAPLFETGIMMGLFALSRLAGASEALQVAIQVAFWALLHGAVATLWAFAPAWLFFVFASVFVTQRKNGLWQAFLVTSAVHALNNLVAMVAIGFERLSG